jgi:hypothetical protein
MLNNPSVDRAFRAVPALRAEEMRPHRGAVALKCFRPSCPDCDAYERGGERDAFEREELGSDVHVHSWDCSEPRKRDLALAAGVEDLPAYVVVGSDGSVRVARPPV